MLGCAADALAPREGGLAGLQTAGGPASDSAPAAAEPAGGKCVVQREVSAKRLESASAGETPLPDRIVHMTHVGARRCFSCATRQPGKAKGRRRAAHSAGVQPYPPAEPEGLAVALFEGLGLRLLGALPVLAYRSAGLPSSTAHLPQHFTAGALPPPPTLRSRRASV